MSLTKSQRDHLVQRIASLELDMYDPDRKALFSIAQKRAMNAEVNALRKQYNNELPEVVLARCPVCDARLLGRVDTYALDGSFWNEVGGSPVTKACQHYVTFQGGLNFHGHVPSADQTGLFNEIHSGPEVPFIIPRLMALNGMHAVLNTLPIMDGLYTAYLVAYFSEMPVAPEQGHQVWLRQSHYYLDASGHRFATTHNDPWDFNIRDWLEKNPNAVRWMLPDDDTCELHSGVEGCPYLEIPGRRVGMVCRQGKMWSVPVPDGSNLDLFD